MVITNLALVLFLLLNIPVAYAGDLKEFGQQQQIDTPKKIVVKKRKKRYVKKLIELHESIQNLDCEELHHLEKTLEQRYKSAKSNNKKIFYLKAKNILAETFFEKDCVEEEVIDTLKQ